MPCSGQLTFSTLKCSPPPFPMPSIECSTIQYILISSHGPSHCKGNPQTYLNSFCSQPLTCPQPSAPLRKISLSLSSSMGCCLSFIYIFLFCPSQKPCIYYPDKQWEEFHIVHTDLIYNLRGAKNELEGTGQKLRSTGAHYSGLGKTWTAWTMEIKGRK